MKRTFRSFPIQHFPETKKQVLHWCHQSGTCVFLDNQQYDLPYRQHECLAAAGIRHMIRLDAGNALHELQKFIDTHGDWCFGHIGYGLKSETEFVDNTLPSRSGFPDLFFFIPEVVIRLDAGEIHIGSFNLNHEEVFKEISSITHYRYLQHTSSFSVIQSMDKQAYIEKIQRIKSHILRGDCYELNYCIEFYAEQADVDPLYLYEQLVNLSPNPFSAYYRSQDLYLACASPERYMSKKADRIFSQPIKGTIRRNRQDPEEDERLKSHLSKSSKERSENVMVVDLVRNDLSRVCMPSSVKVDELFRVHTFPHLHHMISTVSGRLQHDKTFTDIIRSTFPMGSMTGAPKKRVLELIEAYEPTARGLFSGTLGYITPEGDFDFNVVIRSIVYNQSAKYLSYHVGSGITGYADPEQEYAECLLKAEAIAQILKGS